MTWTEVNASLQLEAEDHIGRLMRDRQRELMAQQDAAWAAATKASAPEERRVHPR